MRDCVESIIGLMAGVSPAIADISATADGVESWLKVGGLALLVFLLGRQLVLSWQRNNELQAKLVEALDKCANCPLVKDNNELVRELHRRAMEDVRAEGLPPEKGRMQ